MAIASHYLTLSSLKTAKEELVPLIATELIINIGNNTEKYSQELAYCITNLFTSSSKTYKIG